MSKWMSRKLLVALGATVTAVLVNVGLDEAVATRITDAVTWIASFYLGGQGIADAAKDFKAEPKG